MQVPMHVSSAVSHTAQQDHQHFRALELHVMGQGSKHASLATARRRQRPFTAAFCGESIHVQVSLRNPLNVPLILRKMRLACKFVKHETPDMPLEKPPFEEVAPQGLSAMCLRADASEAAAGTQAIDVMLPAAQPAVVTLELVPREEGWLCVEGLRWDVVPARSEAGMELHAQSAELQAGSHLNGDGLIHAACFWKPRQHRQRYMLYSCTKCDDPVPDQGPMRPLATCHARMHKEYDNSCGHVGSLCFSPRMPIRGREDVERVFMNMFHMH
jgi:hypothetical protein